MFKTPYTTTSLKHYDITKIVTDVQRTMIAQSGNQDIRQMTDPDRSERVLPIYEVLPNAETIGAFTQPIVVQHRDDDIVVVDVRPLVRENRIGEITVASASDYKIMAHYGTLCSVWLNSGEEVLSRYNAFAGRIFVTWLCGMITRTLNLDMLNQVQLKVITGMYFECLFEDDEPHELSPRELQRYVIAASKYSYSNNSACEEILKNVPFMSNLSEYLAVLHKVNPRFEALTTANIYAMVSRSWFGASAPTMCAVALEFPPTWFTMVYFALNYKGYNKTGIGNVVYDSRQSAEAKQFKTGVERLFDDSMIK